MTATVSGDARSPKTDGAKLRVEVCDALTAKRGITTVEAQAKFFGLNRGQMFRLRAGQRTSSLPAAMRMASLLDTTVENLFERIRSGQ